jgi:hypothetical protein
MYGPIISGLITAMVSSASPCIFLLVNPLRSLVEFAIGIESYG